MRYVHSGMLGDDWEAEYDAMQEGDPMYLAKLVEYLAHFQGRYAVGVEAHGPNVGDRERAMAGFRRALGLPTGVAEGDPSGSRSAMRSSRASSTTSRPSFLGVRSDDAMYRFIRGFDGTVMSGITCSPRAPMPPRRSGRGRPGSPARSMRAAGGAPAR